MTVFALLFAVAAVALGVAVCLDHGRIGRAAAAVCALSYAGFFVLLILGSLRA